MEQEHIKADIMMERSKMRGQVRFWRSLVFVVILLVILANNYKADLHLYGGAKLPKGEKYIARIMVGDIIMHEPYRQQMLRDIADDDNIKAVILHINSPGGTTYGGEVLHDALSRISQRKPVVTVMHNMATSAGYLIAMSSERIYAGHSTITGSIGVIFQSMNVKGLADKIGVYPEIIRTGPLKASPTPFETMSPEAEQVITDVINDFFEKFLEIVAEGRGMDLEAVRALADGRIYTGTQAVNVGLVDEIGGEDEAISWLTQEHGLGGIAVYDIDLREPVDKMEQLFGAILPGNVDALAPLQHRGLMSIWLP